MTHLSCSHSGSLNFIVRTAQQHDLAELTEVLSSSFHSTTGFGRWLSPLLRLGIYEDLRQRLRSPASSNHIFLVAIASLNSGSDTRVFIAGTIEITLRAVYTFYVRNSYYPYLSNLAVHTRFRRQGVAQKLLKACEDVAVERGFHELFLHVVENNYPARQLYRKAGYQIQRLDPFWHCWLLRKPRRLLLRKRLCPDSSLFL